MNYLILIVLFEAVHRSHGVIYRLNDSQYLRMPPVYHLDEYNSCLHQPKGIYCSLEMELVSDSPSDLMELIVEYSEHSATHYNHTQLHYGICLTKTCNSFLLQNKTADKKQLLEECLNASMWKDYNLKTRVADKVYCQTLDDIMDIDALDISAAAFFLLLLMLNVIGSLYDFYFVRGSTGNDLLLCFSIKRNWAKLVSPGTKDPYRSRLKCIHGLRALTIVLVILSHSPLGIVIATESAHELELKYDLIFVQLIFNGTIVVQSFFVMSGFLMAYYIQVHAEKNVINWILIPKGIILRWIRLTPVYAVVLIFVCTWMRFTGSGPFWEEVVAVEGRDCRRDGWANMIFVNNYIDNSQCMMHTWYLAADTQLYILGLFVCVFAKSSRSKKVVISALLVIGIIIPSLQTYFQDLNGTLIVEPQSARHYFTTDPTFNNIYRRGHTNIPCFIVGLGLGYIIYKGQRHENKMEKYKKNGIVYTLTVPAVVGLILLGMVFYADRPRPSVYVRAIYAAFLKAAYSVIGAVFFIGVVFKYENVYRRIVEWEGWRVPGRVSYCAYLVHIVVIRIFVGMNTSLWRSGVAQMLQIAVSFIFFSFIIAYPLWLLVESPINDAVLIILRLSKSDKKDDNHLTNITITKETEHLPIHKNDNLNTNL